MARERLPGARGRPTRPLVAAVLVAGFLAWRAGASAVELARSVEPRTVSRAASEGPVARYRRALGPDLELYEAMRRAPCEAAFHFTALPSPEAQLAYSSLQALLFPRRLLPPPPRPVPADWEPGPTFDESVYVVERGEVRDDPWQRWFALEAEGERFRLWRYRGGAR